MIYVLGFLAWLVVLISGGWVFQLLWDWFVVPLGVAHISLAHALGLRILVGAVTTHIPSEGENRSAQHLLAWGLSVNIVSLVFGFVFRLWM